MEAMVVDDPDRERRILRRAREIEAQEFSDYLFRVINEKLRIFQCTNEVEFCREQYHESIPNAVLCVQLMLRHSLHKVFAEHTRLIGENFERVGNEFCYAYLNSTPQASVFENVIRTAAIVVELHLFCMDLYLDVDKRIDLNTWHQVFVSKLLKRFHEEGGWHKLRRLADRYTHAYSRLSQFLATMSFPGIKIDFNELEEEGKDFDFLVADKQAVLAALTKQNCIGALTPALARLNLNLLSVEDENVRQPVAGPSNLRSPSKKKVRFRNVRHTRRWTEEKVQKIHILTQKRAMVSKEAPEIAEILALKNVITQNKKQKRRKRSTSEPPQKKGLSGGSSQDPGKDEPDAMEI